MRFKEMKMFNKVAIITYLIAGIGNIIIGIKTVNMFQILLGAMFFTYILDVYTTELSEKNEKELWEIIHRQEEIIHNEMEFIKNNVKLSVTHPGKEIKIPLNLLGNKIKDNIIK